MRKGFSTTVKLLGTTVTLLWIIASLFLASRASGGNVTYTYDELNRLIQEVYDDGTVINHTYDGAGNRLGKDVTGAGSGITLITPGGGEQWQPGSTQTIYWTYKPAAGTTVKVELLKGGISNLVIAATTAIGTGGSGSIDWIVPAGQAPGANYKIKITSTSAATISDTSAGAFTIDAPPALTVTTPAGGENWAIGASHAINWTYGGDPGSTVKVELLKGGLLQSTPAAAAPIGSGRTGSFPWLIGTDQSPGNDYRIRVTALAGGQSSTSNSFSVTGGITVPYPYGGNWLQAGTTNTVSWTYTGSPGSSVNIDLLKADVLQSHVASAIPIGSGGSGSYSWAIPARQAAGADYRIRITSLTNTACTGTSDSPFTINPSSITVNSPSNGSQLQAGTVFNIGWNYAGNPGATIKIDLLKAGVLKSNIVSSYPIGSSGWGSYPWSIPAGQAAGADYQVRITSTTDKTFSALSGGDFTINPSSITVSSPNGGEKLQGGYPFSVQWSYAGNPDSSVKIELLKGSAVARTITTGTSIGSNGTGSYDWTIPAGQAAGDDYKVRITGVTNSTYSATSGNTFTVAPTAINVTSPNGWEALQRGSTASISWTYTGKLSVYAKIELIKNGATSQVIAPSVSMGESGSGSFSWAIPSDIAVGYDYQVRITSTADSRYTDTSDNTFSIGPVPITVSSPNGGNQLQAGSTFNISWGYTGAPGPSVRIELLKGATVVGTIKSSTSIGSGGWGSYNWALPPGQAAGSDYRIRVTSTSDGACVDTSDAPFTIFPAIHVTYPYGGNRFEAGTNCNIQWSYSGSPGSTVKIDLLKGGGLHSSIVSGTSIGSYGSGSYSWAIPAGHAAGADYQVRITSTTNSVYTDTSDDAFTIIPSSITVYSPNGGGQLQAGTIYNIGWYYAGAPGSSVKIQLLKGSVAARTIISSTPVGSGGWGSYGWAIPPGMAAGDDYKIKITSTTNSAYTDTSDNPFTINPSSITVGSPNGGHSLQAGETSTIDWHFAGSPGSMVKIQLLKGSVVAGTVTSSTSIGSVDWGSGSYSWAIPPGLAAGDDYKIKITSTTDSAYTDTSDGPFTIIPSSITLTSPYWNGTKVQAGTTYGITWDYAGKPGSTVRIDLLDGDAVQYTIASVPLGTGEHGAYDWAVPLRLAAGGTYRFRLTSNSNVSGTSIYFSIVATTLILTSPDSGSSWTAGTTQRINWKYTGSPGSSVRIELHRGGMLSDVISPSTPVGSSGDGYYDWPISSTQAAGVSYRIRVMSTMDNAYSDTGNSDFTIAAP